MVRLIFLAVLAIVAVTKTQADSVLRSLGTAVLTPAQEASWWVGLSTLQQKKLTSIFYTPWFERLPEEEAISFAYVAQTFYDFLGTGADSNPDDHYQSFAPLLLRTAFHSSGSYDHSSGTGGSNGATILNDVELADDFNQCIEKATTEINNLLSGSSTVTLADAMVIAAVVALDVMEFPRMDLLRVEGGRVDLDNIAYRDRLTSPDNDPMTHFMTRYDLSVSELVAVIGGGHNFGAAHGMCSGYIGQWTNSPLTWMDPNTGVPSFFVDLLREDWRWFEVCTFANRTASYTEIDDPFASKLPDPEEDIIPEFTCATEESTEPLVCEEQAMRGCDFVEGLYDVFESPCDITLLQIRLRSDFFLKASPSLLPQAEKFAADPDLLASEFGTAFRKLTHNGLDRCGIGGQGCDLGTKCVHFTEAGTGRFLSARCVLDEEAAAGLLGDDSVDHGVTIALLVLLVVTSILSIALLFKMFRVRSPDSPSDEGMKQDVTPEIS